MKNMLKEYDKIAYESFYNGMCTCLSPQQHIRLSILQSMWDEKYFQPISVPEIIYDAIELLLSKVAAEGIEWYIENHECIIELNDESGEEE